MRQSNIKTPLVFRVGIVLMCAMMLSCYLMSGLYARYTTTVTGSASARVAKIDVEMSGTSATYVGFNDFEFNGHSGDVYAVIERFSVTNTGEVTYNYQLDLRLSAATGYASAVADPYITLGAPDSLSTVKYISGTNTVASVTAGTLASGIGSFQAGKAYYGFSEDNVSFTWNSSTVSGDSYKTLSTLSRELGIGETHYYQVIYFIKMNTQTTLQKMNLTYSVTCEQVN